MHKGKTFVEGAFAQILSVSSTDDCVTAVFMHRSRLVMVHKVGIQRMKVEGCKDMDGSSWHPGVVFFLSFSLSYKCSSDSRVVIQSCHKIKRHNGGNFSHPTAAVAK